MKEQVIAQGAEAILIRKDSELRKKRTRSEAKILQKAFYIINSPKVIRVEEKEKQIVMEWIEGQVLSSNLDELGIKEALEICQEIGKSIALLHNSGIIHGDLTTSNMIFNQKGVFFIDFGLGFHSLRAEDKAVDLHLLKQAFESKHFLRYKEYFDAAIEGYRENSTQEKTILDQLDKVEGRGRYKGKKRENY